ncbi:hypothetical protein ES708_15081 [subsurface metagenome]
MNSKKRILTALSHNQPDRIPMDFGSTPVSGIHVLPIYKLRSALGLKNIPLKVIEPYQMLGEIDDELSDILGIDTIGLSGKNNMFGFANENWKEFKTSWEQTILVPGKFPVEKDKNGYYLMFPEGDTSANPSAKMPSDGFFYDAIIRQDTIDESKLNPENNLEEFGIVTDKELAFWKNQVNQQHKKGKALVANFGGTGLGDIALVPAVQLKHPKGIRDVTEWYISTVTRQDYIHEVFEKQTDIALKNFKKFYDVIGNRIDVVMLCGADFGTQSSQFCSADTFRSLWFPYYKKMNDWIHKNTEWKTFKHSCGSVEPFIDMFIEAGFDILNPVQINAKGMEPIHLKEQFGDRIVFWGGGVDTQKVLSFGTPQEVEKQVLDNCEIFSKNGGFVFNAVHNIQANVPIENILAMFNAFKKINGETQL